MGLGPVLLLKHKALVRRSLREGIEFLRTCTNDAFAPQAIPDTEGTYVT